MSDMCRISFDLWNTLIVPNPEYKSARNEAIARITQRQVETVADMHKDVKQLFDEINDLGHSINHQTCWRMVLGAMDIHNPQAGLIQELEMTVAHLARQHPPIITDSMVEWLNDISLRHTVSILSNTNLISGVTLRNILADRGVMLDQFANTLFSDEEGFAKPSVAFFELLFYGDTARRIHVGDNAYADGVGATLAGFEYVAVKNPSHTIQNVENHLLKDY